MNRQEKIKNILDIIKKKIEEQDMNDVLKNRDVKKSINLINILFFLKQR